MDEFNILKKICRETEMTEIVQTTIKRNLFNKDPNVAWLLALLSSSTICTAYLYLILPQVVDYLYQTVSIETTNISEVCYSSETKL